MKNRSQAELAAKLIAAEKPNFKPRVGIILGSGLGGLSENIKEVTAISYDHLPGFHSCTVEGHGGKLLLGTLEGVPVACLQGRAHLYEGVSNEVVQSLIRTLHLLGCETLLATNAAGSLREEVPPGELMVISDHINFQFSNPLVGTNDEDFGPRFVALEDAYDPQLRQQLFAVAKELNITLHEGVYIGTLGPSFETPAEIRAFRILGADAVGMSTVPEVIVARHCGMKIAVVSVITNLAAGMAAQKLSHHETLRVANQAAEKLMHLITNFVKQLP